MREGENVASGVREIERHAVATAQPVIPSLSRDLEGVVAPRKPRPPRKRHRALADGGDIGTPSPSRSLDKLGMTGNTLGDIGHGRTPDAERRTPNAERRKGKHDAHSGC